MVTDNESVIASEMTQTPKSKRDKKQSMNLLLGKRKINANPNSRNKCPSTEEYAAICKKTAKLWSRLQTLQQDVSAVLEEWLKQLGMIPFIREPQLDDEE